MKIVLAQNITVEEIQKRTAEVDKLIIKTNSFIHHITIM